MYMDISIECRVGTLKFPTRRRSEVARALSIPPAELF